MNRRPEAEGKKGVALLLFLGLGGPEGVRKQTRGGKKEGGEKERSGPFRSYQRQSSLATSSAGGRERKKKKRSPVLLSEAFHGRKGGRRRSLAPALTREGKRKAILPVFWAKGRKREGAYTMPPPPRGGRGEKKIEKRVIPHHFRA